MRKCPKCGKYGETETQRFCNSCGMELFFPERFDDNKSVMNITVFHGSPRKNGNTRHATQIFMDELQKQGNVSFTEFYLPDALPVFCSGCTLCFSGKCCPNAQYIEPIIDEIMKSDALIFATPHYGACSMSGGMKTLLDHLDFFVLNVTPRKEMFDKKVFILTTAAGTTATIKPIKSFLKHWGLNRVYSLGLRLFTSEWTKMSSTKQAKFEKRIRMAAKKFYHVRKKRPYLSTVFYYHISKMIVRKYIGEGNYPYEYWKEQGFFKKRPF